ncbi:MAG: hypothetical protein IPN42_02255 [Methylococcaceae bacterium]|nr:hypothetical protein [Methylococcaceae bacterium]
MTFVIEKIPQEALISSIQEYVRFNIDLSQEWAIDRDRNAFLVLNRKVGGPYDGTQITKYYTLSWNDQLIRITADPLPKTFTKEGAIMNWRIHKFSIPEELQEQKDEVIALIRDAFRALGEFFNGERFISVHVEFKLPSST